MKRLAGYVSVHRKWIIGAALTATTSLIGYAWPDNPWLVTLISTIAVGLGVNAVPNQEATPSTTPGQRGSSAKG